MENTVRRRNTLKGSCLFWQWQSRPVRGITCWCRSSLHCLRSRHTNRAGFDKHTDSSEIFWHAVSSTNGFYAYSLIPIPSSCSNTRKKYVYKWISIQSGFLNVMKCCNQRLTLKISVLTIFHTSTLNSWVHHFRLNSVFFPYRLICIMENSIELRKWLQHAGC